jgi:radical SAM superfamily enzyme YgiQ (UPF0313 family)
MCQDVLMEYMGLMCISGVLRQAGHTVEVFFDDQLNEDRFMRELAAFKPDAVLFSILSPSLQWSLRIGRRVKSEMAALTVYGNVHVITSPQIIDDEGVDIVCLGEGEDPMLELCDALDRGADFSHIEGFWVKTPDGIVRNRNRQDLVDVEVLPFHDREMYNKYGFFRHSHYLRVMAGRGCPFHCSFCSNPVLMDHFGGKRYIRKRTPESMIAEIEHTISRHPTKGEIPVLHRRGSVGEERLAARVLPAVQGTHPASRSRAISALARFRKRTSSSSPTPVPPA